MNFKVGDFEKQEKTSGLKKPANLLDLPSTSSASFVRNPFFNRKKSIEKDFSSILQNSEEQVHENLQWMDVEEDSNEKDSNKKDSNENDSNEKEIHPFFRKTGVSSIVNE